MKKNKILAVICSALAVFSAVSLPLASTGALKVEAATDTCISGDYKYNVLDDGTVSVSKYVGNDSSLQIPSIIDGKKVTKIGKNAFSFCNIVKDVTIPDGVTSIDDHAFLWCKNLANIALPDRLTSIGASAFYGCESLSSIAIPGSVTLIDSEAFRYCKKLQSITLKNGIKTINKNAFVGCKSLQTITIPESVETMGDYMFIDCDSLKSINVDGKNKNYSSRDGVLFNKDKTELITYPCSKNNTSYSIPGKVKTIKTMAFKNCCALRNVTIPTGVVKIGESVFYNNDSLRSVTIPYTVTSIGYYAFAACDNLKSITVDSKNKNYVSAEGVLFNKDKTVLVQYPGGKENISYIVPNSVVLINGEAFRDVGCLDRVVIPAGIKGIGSDAFRGGKLSIIYGYTGTVAEQYADKNDIKFTALSTENIVAGDINGDGKININDAVRVQKAVVGAIEFNVEQTLAADVDYNGKVDILDATTIQRFSIGLI